MPDKLQKIERLEIRPASDFKHGDTGLFLGMAHADYLAVDAFSSTAARIIYRSPLTYRREQDGLLKPEQAKELSLGTILHRCILENKFDAYEFSPDAKKCSWVSEPPILTRALHEEIMATTVYVRTHELAAPLFKDALAEVSGFGMMNGVYCKVRFDLLQLKPSHAVITDLKSTKDGSTRKFSSAGGSYGYHVQAAFYKRFCKEVLGLDSRFNFIALEKGELPLVNVRELDPESETLGNRVVNDAMILLQRCQLNNQWPDYADYLPNEIQKIKMGWDDAPEPDLEGAIFN